MANLDAGLVVAYFVAGLVALALTTVLLRPLWLPLWKLFQGTQQFLEDWFGEPARPGQEARHGAMARLAQLEQNSGSTMSDAIHRIEGEVAEAHEAATQAVTAAGLAVNEAKVGRRVNAESAEANRASIVEIRTSVAGLAAALTLGEYERRMKESAYVSALSRLGVPLLPITDELDEEDP